MFKIFTSSKFLHTFAAIGVVFTVGTIGYAVSQGGGLLGRADGKLIKQNKGSSDARNLFVQAGEKPSSAIRNNLPSTADLSTATGALSSDVEGMQESIIALPEGPILEPYDQERCQKNLQFNDMQYNRVGRRVVGEARGSLEVLAAQEKVAVQFKNATVARLDHNAETGATSAWLLPKGCDRFVGVAAYRSEPVTAQLLQAAFFSRSSIDGIVTAIDILENRSIIASEQTFSLGRELEE